VERNHLVKVVFPALRDKLEKHRVRLVDIDLRCGVSQLQICDYELPEGTGPLLPAD
jgi:hypothetical protein